MYISVFYDVSKHFWTQKLHHKGFKSLNLNQFCEHANLFVCWRDLWVLKLFLDLKVLSQRLQGMTTPSRWFASMWFLMSLPWLPFPQTLQISANWCPLALRFWLFSIIEFTSLSSSSKSPELFPGMANVPFSPRLWIFLLSACLWTAVFGIFAGENVDDRDFSTFSSVFPIKPFNWSSSAIANMKESRLSWKTFASPW